MTGDVERETPPSDQGDEPGLYVSAGDEGAVDSRHGGNRPRPASDLGWGKITALMAWGFVVPGVRRRGPRRRHEPLLVLVFGAAVSALFAALQNRMPRPDRNLTADYIRKRGS